jgi:hypothetical protein
MATPAEKLAASLEILQQLQEGGKVAIRSTELTRVHRERLQKAGFLQEVMKGWYIPVRPDDQVGESTAWYTCFWDFCASYLQERFGDNWCLSPEQSLLLHTGNRTVPCQLVVRTPKGGNKETRLPFETALLDIRSSMPEDKDINTVAGLRLFSVPVALITSSPAFFWQCPSEARAAVAMLADASDVLVNLLAGGHSTIAGRLAGACRNIGRDQLADDILSAMRAAGYEVREEDPFEKPSGLVIGSRENSPYVNRMQMMWESMRETVIEKMPDAPGLPQNIQAYLQQVEESYVTDAYHSLSIEGYRVSRELIEKVRSGRWVPDQDEGDRNLKDAMAARGYWQAYQEVRTNLEKALQGENPGRVARSTHGNWYREMFAPSITAGLLKPADLAGYRNNQVYIRQSKHVPPNRDAVRDLMPVLFDLLESEQDAGVRAVLGHFVFVYIHPYMDGNGRIGRFLMNVMLASGGFPWTVVPLEKRDEYMTALEQASVKQDIALFSEFIADLVREQMPDSN